MASPSATADVVAAPRSSDSDNYLTHDKGYARRLTSFGKIINPLGIRMPETPGRALASLLWHRGILRLRGLKFRARGVPPSKGGQIRTPVRVSRWRRKPVIGLAHRQPAACFRPSRRCRDASLSKGAGRSI